MGVAHIAGVHARHALRDPSGQVIEDAAATADAKQYVHFLGSMSFGLNTPADRFRYGIAANHTMASHTSATVTANSGSWQSPPSG